MMRLVPKTPSKIGTHQLKIMLEEMGFSISQRSIQRDLRALSILFPDLVSDENPDVAGWSWKRNGALQDVPAIDPPMALTFMMAHDHLDRIIPPTILDLMAPYFSSSKKVLESMQSQVYSVWPDRVRIISESLTLIPAVIKENIIFSVYSGLLEGRQIDAQYKSREGQERSYILHPLGLCSTQPCNLSCCNSLGLR